MSQNQDGILEVEVEPTDTDKSADKSMDTTDPDKQDAWDILKQLAEPCEWDSEVIEID